MSGETGEPGVGAGGAAEAHPAGPRRAQDHPRESASTARGNAQVPRRGSAADKPGRVPTRRSHQLLRYLL